MPAACRWVAVNAVEASERGRRIGILAPAEDLAFLAEGGRGHRLPGGIIMRPYGSRRRPEQSARELFDALRGLDAALAETNDSAGADATMLPQAEIYALAPTPDGIGLAIHDRLTRAAEGRVITVDD